jgi:hypothetical protein
MARPKKQINPPKPEDVIYEMALNHNPRRSIASVLKISEDLLERRFAEILTKAKDEQEKRLLQWQWESAQKGNVVMQIWLGKQYLGQRDKQDVSVTDNGPKTVNFVFKVIDDKNA